MEAARTARCRSRSAGIARVASTTMPRPNADRAPRGLGPDRDGSRALAENLSRCRNLGVPDGGRPGASRAWSPRGSGTSWARPRRKTPARQRGGAPGSRPPRLRRRRMKDDPNGRDEADDGDEPAASQGARSQRARGRGQRAPRGLRGRSREPEGDALVIHRTRVRPQVVRRQEGTPVGLLVTTGGARSGGGAWRAIARRRGYPLTACAGSVGTCRGRGQPRRTLWPRWRGPSSIVGPDAEGQHVDGPVALGHRRLSIIDLSEAAHEPISNEDGSLWLVFNGEIYNFRELRKGLEGRHRFRSQGDAEVILHLYEEQGDEAVKALDGMFAFALWDGRRRRLLLARDRAGKKPLFYHDGPGAFAFASEVKALLAHPDVPHERDERGAAAVPDLRLRADARDVLPRNPVAAARAHPRGDGGGSRGTPALLVGAVHRWSGARTIAEAEERFRTLLEQAVERRLVADVPLGAFLSGGLDSSAVVAFMARAAAGRVKTFCIGFAGGREYDEREHARVVAERFGTEHTEFVVEPKALELIDRLVWHHDGPFGDSSAIPTYLLSELTRTPGDGGAQRGRRRRGVRRIPAALRGGALGAASPVGLRPGGGGRWACCPSRGIAGTRSGSPSASSRPGGCRSSSATCAGTRYFTERARRICCGRSCARTPSASRVLESFARELEGDGSTLARLLQLNFQTYLLDDLLVKMDRMSMAHGLEARSPFLDTAVVEFGASLPEPAADALRHGEDPAAAGDEGDPAGVDPGPGEDGLRGAARGVVPRGAGRAGAGAAARPGEPDLRVPAARAGGGARDAPRERRRPTCRRRSGRC